ncbi:MAG: RagB/SusD family nutrient uptake outer membrane protein [Balneolaceae bacterium]|nr:RagB/SusD family nutrient uptake outer membrane protein [Balneolaceae bacterium]
MRTYSTSLDNYGNIPIATDYSSEELPEQRSRQEVYNFIVQELTASIPNLSEATGQSMYGRINKWAGKAILADVYLNAEVYTGTPEWDKVIETTDEIIQSGSYELEENYKDNFTRDNQNSTENMWSVVFDQVNAPDNNYHMVTGKTEFNEILRHAG